MASPSTQDTVVGQSTSNHFDPFAQMVQFYDPHQEPMKVPLQMLEEFRKYCVYTSINFGTQIGASVVVLVLMLMLMKPTKFRSPVIVLNAFAVVINIIRSILQCFFFTGAWSNIYAVFASDYSRITEKDYAISSAVLVLVLILVITIELSLVLQVRAVCVTTHRYHRLVIMFLSISVACIAIGFRFAWAVTNIRAINKAENTSHLDWLSSCSNITTTASISFFSAIFVAKLLVALRQRRRMGLKQFGPMQVIIIMGFQTMTIPAIFSGVQYLPDSFELYTQVLTLTAIFLPLSSIWASTAVDGKATSPNNKENRWRFIGDGSTGSTRASSKRALNHSTQDSGYSHGFGSFSEANSMSEKNQGRARDIMINRSFTVESNANQV